MSMAWNWDLRLLFCALSSNSRLRPMRLDYLCSSYILWLKTRISNLTAKCWQTSLTLVAMEVSVDLTTLRRDFYSWEDVIRFVGKIPSRCSCTTCKCLETGEEVKFVEGEKKYFSNSSTRTSMSSSAIAIKAGWLTSAAGVESSKIGWGLDVHSPASSSSSSEERIMTLHWGHNAFAFLGWVNSSEEASVFDFHFFC